MKTAIFVASFILGLTAATAAFALSSLGHVGRSALIGGPAPIENFRTSLPGRVPNSLAASSYTWHWAYPKPSGDLFNAVAFGNSVYVAVGEDSIIYSSPNAASWTQRQASFADGSNLSDVIYAGGRFVAVGETTLSGNNATNVAYTSTDGINWSSNTIGTILADGTIGIGFGNSTYVEMSNSAWTSSDGQSWTQHNIAGLDPATSTVIFNAPIFGAGTFVAHGLDYKSGVHSIYFSTDNGSSWSAANITIPSGGSLFQIANNGSTFVAIGMDNSGTCGSVCGLVYTSTNGQTWTRQANQANFGYDLTVGGTAFYNDTGSVARTSTNGTTWTTILGRTGDPIGGTGNHDLIWNGGTFVSTTDYTHPLEMMYGTTFGHWTQVTGQVSGFFDHWWDMLYDGSKFVAFGYQLGENHIMTSPDGANWTLVYSGTSTTIAGAVSSDLSKYVAVGYTVLVSTNGGSSWTTATTPPPSPTYFLYSVAYGAGKFVTVGVGGGIFTSTDGETWTQQTSGTTDNLQSIVWTGTRFVAGAACFSQTTDGNSFFTSPDGITWTPIALSHPAGDVDLFCTLRMLGSQVVATGGEFAYTGALPSGTVTNDTLPDAPVVASSADGLSWTPSTFTVAGGTGSAAVTDIAQVNGQYVAVQTNALFTSGDLVNWEFLSNNPYSENALIATGLVAANNVLIAYGEYGDIAYSDVPAGPTATNGSATTTAGTAVSGTLTGGGSGLTFTVTQAPGSGTAVITDATTGAFTYTPNAGFTGSDSFAFSVTSNTGTATATESVTVNAASSGGGSGGTGGGSSGSGSGGGGGDFSLLAVALLGLLVLSRPGAQTIPRSRRD